MRPPETDIERQRDMAENVAMVLEFIAVAIVRDCSSIEEATLALEMEALRLKRMWRRYPVACPGEREYLSWMHVKPVRREGSEEPLNQELANRFAHVQITEEVS